MAKTREIKGRMKAISNIERITKTMQMIATVRFQAAFQDATASKPYAHKIAELVDELVRSLRTDDQVEVDHPLLRPASGSGKHLVLVFSSNRGLCGAYNTNVLRTATAFIKDHSEQGVDLEVVGKKGISYFRFAGLAVSQAHTQFGDKPAYGDIELLADRYIKAFIDGEYDAVSVAFMAFESVARQNPDVATLLPLQNPLAEQRGQTGAGRKPSANVEYEFSPDSQTLLDQLLPVSFKTQLVQCFYEANVSEHIARMVAMKNATNAADKMGKGLIRKYNRARQTAITTELSEIIGGAAALQ